MSTVIVTKEIEVNVVKVPDYTDELNQIEEAKIIVENAVNSCEDKAYEMGKDIVEQIGIYISNLMRPVLRKYSYKEISGYFSTYSFEHNSFYLNLGLRDNKPFLFLKSAGTYDDCRLLMEFYGDDDYEIVRNVMDAELIACLVSEWPKLKDMLITENKRFINNKKVKMEKDVQNITGALKVIESFKL